MHHRLKLAGLACFALIALLCAPVYAQEKPLLQSKNLLNLSASVSTQITPDTALITLFAERTGPDAAIITSELNSVINEALKDAKKIASIDVATGNFSSYPQHDNKGKQTGWTVRSELMLKSKAFGTLSQLAGTLTKTLKISGTGFEVSRLLKAQEEEKLMQNGLVLFQSKAKAASKALGFEGYWLREINLDQAQLDNHQARPMMMRSAVSDSTQADVPMQASATTLTLTVRGSVVMQ